ncbi:MAG: HypC/HybG/HupF family hydrogenase formation chaperone [ANME-2 cluster archaeon]|nr:HypC/HybG/HupF family hydrogenase formation chaperone [ANME-2 cluster archaeon]MDF1531055.1 HypC/HybG/HupF family hydrogenase formation chaperone [ANME-2 cluster archaeon]
MCYAIPARIINIKGDEATADYGGVKKKVNINLVDNVDVGDYVLIHAGFIIEKLDKRSAEESLEIIREYINESERANSV